MRSCNEKGVIMLFEPSASYFEPSAPYIADQVDLVDNEPNQAYFTQPPAYPKLDGNEYSLSPRCSQIFNQLEGNEKRITGEAHDHNKIDTHLKKRVTELKIFEGIPQDQDVSQDAEVVETKKSRMFSLAKRVCQFVSDHKVAVGLAVVGTVAYVFSKVQSDDDDPFLTENGINRAEYYIYYLR